ncbi:hypothetical protein [Sinomonas sp.]|jgi:hypothetical protein|uniref:hypothetical protein n=1 Tax=Sinomonas sp. TaxID=1914986 RepID=UPI002FDFDE42
MGKQDDEDIEVWSAGLMWVEAAEMQCARFQRAAVFNAAALLDARTRSLLEAHPERRDESRPPVLVPTVALHLQERIEGAFLLSAVGSVFRAHDRLPWRPLTALKRTALKEETLLRDLRTASEHWDQYGRSPQAVMETEHAKAFFESQERLARGRGREALARFRELARDDPWAVFELPLPESDEVWIWGIPLAPVRGWLREVRQRLERALKVVGQEAPGMLKSRIEGDDGVEWPQERARYRLWREDMKHLPEHGF